MAVEAAPPCFSEVVLIPLSTSKDDDEEDEIKQGQEDRGGLPPFDFS